MEIPSISSHTCQPWGQLLSNWICRPLKKYLSVRSHERLPRKSWKLVSLASEWLGDFSKIYPELFPASPETQLQEITVSSFSIQLGEIRLQSIIGSKNAIFDPIGVCNPVGSKKCWRRFPANGPLEKRGTALDRSWRNLRLILRWGRPISSILGANAHANVLKSTFSTDYKLNWIGIALKMR